MTVPAARLRAGVFTTTGLLLSAAAHVVGEGSVPGLGPMVAVGGLSLLTVGILGRTRRGPVSASAAMVALQVSAHLALSGHHHMAVQLPPWPMLLAHGLCAAALGAWLSGVDRSLSERLLLVLSPLRASLLPAFGQLFAEPVAVSSYLVEGAVPGRGPPRSS